MNTIVLIIVSLVILAFLLIVGVLYLIQSKRDKDIKKQLEKLEIEKNKIDSAPIVPELSKIESYLNNEKLEAMYNNWKDRLDVIRTNQIPKITDMLLEADYSLSKMDYKSAVYKIAKLEMEIYKVKTNSDFLLNEIKEITSSEERNRGIITKLKSIYRDLYQKFKNSKEAYGEINNSIELQFENIAKHFEKFEAVMEKNEYTEVTSIIKTIDEMLKHMTVVVEEVPSIVLLATSILPKKIEEVEAEYTTDLQAVSKDAKLYIVSLKDDALVDLLPQITEGKQASLLVHTAGSIPMSVWEGHAERYGVFYPMQTFSKQREVKFQEVPFFIEAKRAEDTELLKAIASTLSEKVYEADSEQRKSLHLAAVFICNFTNHMYALAADLLEKYNLPFEVMLPLIDETARKVHELAPRDAQTGPAVRYDENVMSNHLAMLVDSPALQEIYKLMSKSIHEHHKL